MSMYVYIPLIILYTEMSYTYPNGGVRSATVVGNDNHTRDDDDALLFFTTHRN